MNRTLFIALALGAHTAAAAAAQTLADYDYDNLSFRGIGFDVGYIWPNKVDPTPAYSLKLDLGFLGPAVRIMPSITYWRSELKRGELERFADRLEQLPSLRDQNITIDPSELGAVKWNDVSLAVDAQMVWTAPFDVYTYVGAGLGLHVLRGSGDAINDTFVEDLLDATTAGVSLSAGLELEPIRVLRLYGEARYTAVTDVSYPGIRFGAALMLPSATTATAASAGDR